jgi:hypothetical protein
MPSNPITPEEQYDILINRSLTPRDGVTTETYMAAGYITMPPATVDGPVKWRLFDAAYIKTGIVDPNRLGTGATGAGNLYLADDGTWKVISGAPGIGDMLKATYDTDNSGIVDKAEALMTLGRNSTGATLYKGTIIRIQGSTGHLPNFVKAQGNNDANSAQTFGVIAVDIPNNSDGYVVVQGTIDNLDTRSVATNPFTDVTLADGDILYLHPTIPGYLTNVKPSAPQHLVYVGVVTRTSPTNGTIVYRIQNGYELDEIHDVAIASKANNDLLVYESATSLWKNKTFSAIFGGTPLVSVPTLAAVTTAGNTTTNAITVGGLTVATNLIYTDTVNGRVGIGTTSPAYRLDVKGTTTTHAVSSDIGYNISRVAAPTGTLTLTPSTGGSVDVGQHYYFVSFVTAIGETTVALSTSITIVSGSQTVTITGIPTSTDPRVTGRRIYRTRAGQTSDRGALLTTINDNTTTSYVDTVADSTLPNTGDWAAYRENTTSRQITIDGTRAMLLGTAITSIGFGAGANITTAGLTTLVGYNAGNAITYGFQNTLVGTQAGRFVTTGNGNTVLGSYALMWATTASDNISIGQGSSFYNVTGSYNIAIGSGALSGQSGASHSSNIAIGTSALANLGAANNNVALGYFAGRYISNGSANTLSSNSIFIGYDARPNAISQTNQIVIGYSVSGLGSNTTILGNSSTTFTSIPAGNLAVGTTTDNGNKLNVAGTTRLGGNTVVNGTTEDASGTATLTIQTTNTSLRLGGNTTYSWIQTHSGKPLYINELGNNVILNLGGGSVGIGTASPGYKLDVNGAVRVQSIAAGTADYDRFLVSDSGVVKYRTGNEILSDIDVPGYVSSRGENLVTNGTGLRKSNYNFSAFTFVGSEAYYSTGSFRDTTFNSSPVTDEAIPVDVNQRYRLSVSARQNPYVGARYYVGVSLIDADGLPVNASNHMYKANTLTTLAAPLNPGDTVMYLTSAANWENGGTAGVNTHLRSIILWNYVNSLGYAFPALTYSRNWYGNMWDPGSVNTTTNTITLRVPWAFSTIAAGTQLSNGSSGGTYKYITAVNVQIPNTWTNYTGTIEGVDTTGTNVTDKFAPGTAAIKILFLNNRDVAGATVYYTNVQFGLDLINPNTLILNQSASVQTANFNISGNGYIGGNLGLGTTVSAGFKLDAVGSGRFQANSLTTTVASGGLTLANTTAATSGVTQQNSPSVIFSGSAWVSGALKTHDIAIQSEPQTWDSTRMIWYKRLNSGSWIPFFGLRSDSTPQYSLFLYPVGYLKDGVGQAHSAGFTISNGIQATAVLQQFSPAFMVQGYGWNGTSSVLTSSSWLFAPEAGTTTFQGVSKFIYNESLNNELVRYEFGERLGMWVNKLSLANYVTTINSRTTITGSVTAASAIARGTYLNQTLVAAANNDVLVGLDINPTFTNGAFTGVQQENLVVRGGTNPLIRFKNAAGTTIWGQFGANATELSFNAQAGSLNFVAGNTQALYIFTATRNVLIQNGGTFTDVGYRLDVNGTFRAQGSITATLASTSTANVVYYNSSTGLLTYGAVPTPTTFQIDYDYNIVGLKNGSNVVFTSSANFVLTTTRVYLNGVRLTRGVGYDYVETGTNQITLASAPNPTDQLIIEYQL